MDRFSRFRRHHKKAAAAAAVAAIPAATGDSVTPAATSPLRPSTAVPTSSPSMVPDAATPSVPDTTDALDGNTKKHARDHTPPTQTSFFRTRRTSPSPQTQPQPDQTQAQNQILTPARTTRTTRSPFRELLRSTKRARGSPPQLSTLSRSPTAVLSSQFQSIALPATGSNGAQTLSAGDTGGASAAGADLRRSGSTTQSSRRPKMPPFLSLSVPEIDLKFQKLVWLERTRMQSAALLPGGRWTRVTGSHLRFLDRYNNIQPWDKNRVRLKVPPGQIDYINASPIELTTTAPAHGAPQAPDRYIAMQGPKQSSVDHVWRMVYEQLRSPAVIIMLTETHEANLEKCYPYFPRSPDDPPMRINEHDEFGDGFQASVRCAALEETPWGDAVELRRLQLRVHRKASPVAAAAATATEAAAAAAATAAKTSGEISPNGVANDVTSAAATPIESAADSIANATNGAVTTAATRNGASSPDTTGTPGSQASQKSSVFNEDEYEDERIVYHFLYRRWPDFGVPELSDMDSFFGIMRLSAEKNADADNPRVVHCSAGVGRSGTFIALEHLVRELDAGVLENYNPEDPGLRGRVPASASPPAPSTPSTSAGAGAGAGADTEGTMTSTEAARAAAISLFSGGLDALAATEADDLIFMTVNQLREQRRTMVQAESQYLYIYQVMRKLWEDKYGTEAGVGDDDEMPDADAAETVETADTADATDVAEAADGDDDGASEPAAKRLEVDPFVNGR